MPNQFALASGITSASSNESLGGGGSQQPRDKKLNFASPPERKSQLPFESGVLWSECMPCARLSPFPETSEFSVDCFSGSLAVSRIMAPRKSGRRPTELSPVGGNWRGADVRQVLGCYLGGDGWGGNTSICEPRCPRLYGRTESAIATVLILDRAGSKRIRYCTQPSERRSCYSCFITRSLLESENGEGTLAASQLFTVSFFQPVPANASAQSHPLLIGPSPPNASSIPTPRDSSKSASRTVSVSEISKAVSPFTAPPLRCWCRSKSSIAIRRTRCSVRLETDVSLPLNVS